jgi:hypothetical protein
MTSEQLDEVSEERRKLLAQLLGNGKARTCDFPQLGQGDCVLVQQVRENDGSMLINLFNTGDNTAERTLPGRDVPVSIEAHESHLLTF